MDSVLSSGKVAEGQIQCAEEVIDEEMDDDNDNDDEEEDDDDEEDNMDTSAAVETVPQVWHIHWSYLVQQICLKYNNIIEVIVIIYV